MPMADRPFMIYTDASAYAVGVVLPQQQDLEYSKKGATIVYWSKALATAETNFSKTEVD